MSLSGRRWKSLWLRPYGLALGHGFSFFPKGTEVPTQEGRDAIERLREGDLAIARDEDTGVSGVFPVAALMKRQSDEVLWFTLENADGKVSRLGLTGGHPMFVVGSGWTVADDVAAGDAIRNADLRELKVLAVDIDKTSQIVHNLEIAGAHTYFAGELDAWGHNAKSRTSGENSAAAYGRRKHNEYRCDLPRLTLPSGKRVDAWDEGTLTVYELKPDTPAQRRRGKKQLAGYVCELQEQFGDDVQGILEYYTPFKR